MASSKYVPYLSHFVPIQQFFGGQSSDEAIGTPSSFSYSRAMDHRSNPSQLTVLPGPRKLSEGVVQDLILNMVQTKDGTRYGLGDQGYIYKVDTSNVITYLNKLTSGTDGCLYRTDSDAIYFASKTRLHRYYPISGTPTFDVTYGPTKSIDPNAYRTGGQPTTPYLIPKTLEEGQACYFQPDIEPFYSIKANITVVGTGDMTLTLHDGVNNSLAAVTIPNANLKVGLNEFLFGSQIRALVKPNARTYHFHLTSSVNEDTTAVAAATAGLLNTADFELWAYLLVDTVNGFHPITQFQQFTCVGNGNYLMVWEPLTDVSPPNAELQRHRLVFPAGFEVCGLAVTDEFLVIACAKYSTDGTKDFQEGKLFTWDGTAQTYNQIVDVSGGAPEGIKTKDNMPYFIVNGKLCAWPGGKNIIQVRKIAALDNTFTGVIDNTRVYPNMLCIKDNMLHLGFPSKTTNQSVEHGIYVWGALEKNYAESFNYGYVPSTQDILNTSGNLRLGCVSSFGDEMYMSVQYLAGGYGLEIVDNLCKPAPIYKFRARRFDGGQVHRDKIALKVAVVTDPLPSGVGLTVVSSINGGTYVNGQSMAAGDTRIISSVEQPNNFRRIVTGFDGTCDTTVTAGPAIFCEIMEYKPQETQFAIS